MALEPPTAEIIAAIREACEIDEESLLKAGKDLKKWLNEQPHLPNGQDENRLMLLYLQCKKNMDKVHDSLDTYYSLRNTIPEILYDRDPYKPWFKFIVDHMYYVPLPRLADDLCRVTITGFCEQVADASDLNVYDMLKMNYMVEDVRQLEEFCPFDIYIVNLKNCTVKHVLLYSYSAIKKITEIGLRRYRLRIKSVHYINAPIYLDIVICLMKLVLKPKLFKRMHVHRNGIGNLHEFVPPNILPVEVGGTFGSIKDFWSDWKIRLMNHREWFVEQDQYRTDESKRPKKN